jgi:hypothetical protein
MFFFFFFIFHVRAQLYCAIGIYFNRVKLGVTEWRESIPHVEFWEAVPGHLWDGIMWTKEKVQSLISSHSSAAAAGYQPVATSESSTGDSTVGQPPEAHSDHTTPDEPVLNTGYRRTESSASAYATKFGQKMPF